MAPPSDDDSGVEREHESHREQREGDDGDRRVAETGGGRGRRHGCIVVVIPATRVGWAATGGEAQDMASAPQTRDRSRSGWGTVFALVALAEGFTWAGLLIGMFLKYVTETTEAGVALFGMLHGIVFVVYVLVTLIVWWRLRWSVPVGLLALVASVPPLTTVPFEIWAQRRGLLRATPRD